MSVSVLCTCECIKVLKEELKICSFSVKKNQMK